MAKDTDNDKVKKPKDFKRSPFEKAYPITQDDQVISRFCSLTSVILTGQVGNAARLRLYDNVGDAENLILDINCLAGDTVPITGLSVPILHGIYADIDGTDAHALLTCRG